MGFVYVKLATPADRFWALADFYDSTLGLKVAASREDRLSIGIGETELEFFASGGKSPSGGLRGVKSGSGIGMGTFVC